MTLKENDMSNYLDEFVIEFEKIRNEVKNQIRELGQHAQETIEKSFDKQRNELKVDLAEIKTELKKLSIEKEMMSKDILRIEIKNEAFEKDVNDVATMLRKHMDDNKCNETDLQKVKWEVGLGKWLAVSALAVSGSLFIEFIKRLFSGH